MAKILLIAEHDGKTLNPSTAKALTGALGIGNDVDIAVFAADASAVAEQAAKLEGIKRVVTIEKPENEHLLAATLAPQIRELAGDYSHVLAPSTTFGKDVMPRAAALLGTAQVSDIMEVVDETTFRRPAYASNVILKVRAPAEPLIVGTIRPASFRPAADGDAQAPVESASVDVELPTHTRWVDIEGSGGDRPDLQSASRVVSGGRGLGNEENFRMVFRLADKLGAAVGASRAAVDAGYVPNEMQVGQTGKVIAPELYIAVGISGAIQHITGIKDAQTIVAINKDGDAPIFDVADIGLVGDLFKLLPELEEEIDKLGG